jgi:hypothetical protein
MQYIVACRFEHKNYLVSNNGETLERKLNLLKINERYEWYYDNLYAPMIPFREYWYKNKNAFWWDVIDEKCQLRLRDAIQTMDNTLKTEEDKEIVDWLKYWEAKGACFIQVNNRRL